MGRKIVEAGVSLITAITLAGCQAGLVSAPPSREKPTELPPSSASAPNINPTEESSNPMIGNQIEPSTVPVSVTHMGNVQVPDFSVTQTPKVKPTEVSPTKNPTPEPTVGALQESQNFPYVGHDNLNAFSNDEALKPQIAVIEKICLNWATADKPPIDCSGLFDINDNQSPRSTDIFNINGRLVIGFIDRDGNQRYALPKGAIADPNYNPESGYAEDHKLTDNDSALMFGDTLSPETITTLGVETGAVVTFDESGTALVAKINGKTIATVSDETGMWEKVVELHSGLRVDGEFDAFDFGNESAMQARLDFDRKTMAENAGNMKKWQVNMNTDSRPIFFDNGIEIDVSHENILSFSKNAENPDEMLMIVSDGQGHMFKVLFNTKLSEGALRKYYESAANDPTAYDRNNSFDEFFNDLRNGELDWITFSILSAGSSDGSLGNPENWSDEWQWAKDLLFTKYDEPIQLDYLNGNNSVSLDQVRRVMQVLIPKNKKAFTEDTYERVLDALSSDEITLAGGYFYNPHSK
ncbi:MAG TPA: hypothetical protein PK639_00095 [Candidatus Woesebacteria bacterium]|nr:hypothetical protein [Candidatus Woesebacteria bacterium]